MRLDTQNFSAANSAQTKNPRYVVAVDFGAPSTYLSAATTAAATTVNVVDASEFSTSGSGTIGGADAFTWTGKTATTLTGCSGVAVNVNGSAVVETGSASVVKYFTTHDDCEVPTSVTASDVLYSTLRGFSSISQDVDPLNARSSISSLSFTLTDVGSSVTQLFQTQRAAGRGERMKEVTVYVGYRGMEWADYSTVQVAIIDEITGGKGEYKVSCSDIQRETRKKIFIPERTNLTTSISSTDITLAVVSNDGFELVQHGTSYGDAPSLDVAYVRIGDEIIRLTGFTSTTQMNVHSATSTTTAGYSAGAASIVLTDGSDFRTSGIGYVTQSGTTNEIRWTGRTSNTLTGVTGIVATYTSGATVVDAKGRGALNTKAVAHEIDQDASNDRQPEVKEHVYIELPAPKLAYALLTGTLYGDAETIPDHWHCGVDASHIATSQFTGIGADLWDTSDDTAGLILRISGMEDQDAKALLEKSIYRPAGIYPVINVDGQLGIRRINRVLADASYIAVLDETNIVEFGELTHSKDVQNAYLVTWNRDDLKGRNTRANALIDSDSTGKYGPTEIMELDFGLMHGSRTTLSTVKNTFHTLRDRYAAPPLRLTVKCLHRMNHLDPGDIVRVNLDGMLRDLADSSLSFNRSMEIKKKSVDWFTGQVSFDLIGSAERAGVIVDSGTVTVLANGDYSTGHTALATALTSAGITYTDVGGLLTITGSGTLAGNASLAAGGNYYYLGDLTVNNGVTLTITNNVGLWVAGTITNNGTINGAGQGIAASASGTAGGIGTTKATGGFRPRTGGIDCFEMPTVVGDVENLSAYRIEYGSNGITGIPTDLRGSSGGDGGSVQTNFNPANFAAGGSGGGDGGAGLLVVCRGFVAGPSSSIDISGDDGAPGVAVNTAQPGSSAGGAPGGFLLVLDGSGAAYTDVEDHLVALQGDSPTPGQQATQPSGAIPLLFPNAGYDVLKKSFFLGFPADDHRYSHFRAAYIHDLRDPQEDVADEADIPQAISVQQVAANQLSLNTIYLEIGVTGTAGNYRGSRVLMGRAADDAFHDIGVVLGSGELVSPALAADGATYVIRAYPISISGAESEDYLETSFTVASTVPAVIGTGSSVATSTTVGEGTNGEGVVIDDAGVRGYSTAGDVLFDLDATSGQIQTLYATINEGGITINGGGAIKSTGKSFGTGAGIYYGWDSGQAAYVFDVGDHDTEKFVEFDGTDLKLGRQTQLLGADNYYSTNQFIHWYFDSLDGAYTYTVGTNSAITVGSSSMTMICDGAASDTAQFYKGISYSITEHTWLNSTIRLKTRVYVDMNGTGGSLSNYDIYIMCGSTSSEGFGFFNDNGVLKGFNKSTGYSIQTVTLTATFSSGNDYLLEATRQQGLVEFYVDGVYQNEIAPEPFSSSAALTRYVSLQLNCTTSDGTGELRLGISEWMLLVNS